MRAYTRNYTALHRVARKLKRTDLFLMRILRRTECTAVTLLMRLLTRIGNPSGWVLISVAIMFQEGSIKGVGLKMGLVSFLAALVAKGVKHSFRRQRPCLHESFPKALAPVPDQWSFPSGHTASAFAVAFFLLVAGTPAAPFFVVLALGIAISRAYLGVHFPSDVFGGMCLGALVGISAFPFITMLLGG